MKLTNVAISQGKPTGKTQKLFDGGGLFLEVTPTGARRWRFKYRAVMQSTPGKSQTTSPPVEGLTAACCYCSRTLYGPLLAGPSDAGNEVPGEGGCRAEGATAAGSSRSRMHRTSPSSRLCRRRWRCVALRVHQSAAQRSSGPLGRRVGNGSCFSGFWQYQPTIVCCHPAPPRV